MTPVEFHPLALEELRAAADFYEREAPGLGTELLAEIRRVVRRIGTLPRAAPVEESGIRRTLLRRFPFSVVYCFENNRIVIIAVMHQRRKPGYWRERGAQ